MNFVISKNLLYNQIQIVDKAVAPKSNVAILSRIRMEVKENNLTITASDLENTITTTTAIEDCNGECVVAIEAESLKIIKGLPEQPLSIEVDQEENTFSIVFQNGSYNLSCIDGNDFPQTPVLRGETKTSIEIPSEVILNGINYTLFAAAKDEMRPIMNGINVAFSEDGVYFAATDGQRLSRYLQSEIMLGKEISFVFPRKPAEILKNILPKSEKILNLEFDDKNAVITFDNIKYVCRFQEGNFPNYQQIIPKNNPYKIIVDRLDILSTVQRVAQVANKSQQLIGFTFNDNIAKIVGSDIEYATSGKEEIACQYEGEKFRIGFKSNVIIEILSALNSKNVVFELSDPSRAGLIVPYEKENINEDVLMLAMPLMILDED